MPIVSFEMPDGDDVDVDSDEVVEVRAGEEEGTAVIELDDGSEVTVVATALEAAADLGIDLQDVIDEDDDEALDEDD